MSFPRVPARLPCFADMRHRPSSTGLHFRALDGVRGLAPLLVLYQHVALQLPSAGLIGVFIFFAASGFLLVQPFCRGRPAWLRYGVRRFLRLAPMYVAAVFLLHAYGLIMPGRESLLRHLTLRWTDFILWSIKQEVYFYGLLPLLAFGMRLLPARTLSRPFALAVAAVAFVLAVGPVPVDWFNHMPAYPLPLYAAVFILGMAGGAFLHTEAAQRLRAVRRPVRVANGLSLAWAALMTLLIIYRPPLNPWMMASWHGHFFYGLLLTALLAQLVLLPCGLVHRFFMLAPLRAVGIVCYSFYLLHIPVLHFLPDLPKWVLFPVAACVSYAVSCLTYCLVERPCMALGRRGQ